MKISIVICNYNHGEFIEQSIKSFMSQTYENIQMVILDDGSTDGSCDIISNLAANDSRIIFAARKNNRGFTKVFPEAMSLADGDFVICGAADDYLCDREFFEKAMDMQCAIPSSGVYGLTLRIESDTGKHLSIIGLGAKDGLINAKEFCYGFFDRQYFVPGHSALWRKSLVDVVGGYPMDLGPQNDYYINHVLPSVAGVHFIDSIVAVTRINPKSMSYGAELKDKIVRHATFQKRILERTGFDNHDIVSEWREQLIYDLCDGKQELIPENRNLYLQTLND